MCGVPVTPAPGLRRLPRLNIFMTPPLVFGELLVLLTLRKLLRGAEAGWSKAFEGGNKLKSIDLRSAPRLGHSFKASCY